MNIHELRKDIDGLIYKVEQIEKNECISKEEPRLRNLVRTKLQEAKMWAGQILGAQGGTLPKQHRDFCDKREDDETPVKTKKLDDTDNTGESQ